MLYVHAGTVKTGTTYIQKTLYENREIFEKFGIIYLPVHPSDLPLPRYANARFLYDSSLEPRITKLIDINIEKKMIISEEGIFGNITHLLNPAIRDVEKKIIIYVRRTAEVLAAWSSEFCNPYNIVKFSGDDSFHPTKRQIVPIHEAMEIASHEYSISLARFMNMVDVLGCDNFIVRPYERESFLNGDLLSDFLSHLGIKACDVRSNAAFNELNDINLTQNRKFCDISNFLWLKMNKPNDLADFNFDIVSSISRECHSGDPRSVVETLSDAQIKWYTCRFAHFEDFLSRKFAGGKAFFKNKYPLCFEKVREAHQSIDLREVNLLADLYLLRKDSFGSNGR